MGMFSFYNSRVQFLMFIAKSQQIMASKDSCQLQLELTGPVHCKILLPAIETFLDYCDICTATALDSIDMTKKIPQK